MQHHAPRPLVHDYMYGEPHASLPLQEDSEASSCASMGDCKLVLVVRMDLKMGKGKIAAQVCTEDQRQSVVCERT